METHEEWRRGCEERLLLAKQTEAAIGFYWLIGWICARGLAAGTIFTLCGTHG